MRLFVPNDRDTDNNCWASHITTRGERRLIDVTFKAIVLKLILIRGIIKEDNISARGCLLIVFDCTFMLLSCIFIICVIMILC